MKQIQQVLSYFSTCSPPELRHLSYRGTNFCILCLRSLPPEIGTTVWHSSPPVILKTLPLTAQEFLEACAEMTLLTPCALLCVLVAVALAPTWRTIFWTTCAPWHLCNREWEICGKWLLAQLTMNFDRNYAPCIQNVTRDRTSPPAGVRIRSSTAATMLRWELGKSRQCMRHATSLLYHVHAVA